VRRLSLPPASGGTIYPILDRLQGLGWLVSRLEDGIPQGQVRPRRRYYHLTGPGEVASDEARKEFPGKLGLGSSMKNDVLKRKDNAITCGEGG
jgi:DNA-binding PadR family transcriptional regulator